MRGRKSSHAKEPQLLPVPRIRFKAWQPGQTQGVRVAGTKTWPWISLPLPPTPIHAKAAHSTSTRAKAALLQTPPVAGYRDRGWTRGRGPDKAPQPAGHKEVLSRRKWCSPFTTSGTRAAFTHSVPYKRLLLYVSLLCNRVPPARGRNLQQ